MAETEIPRRLICSVAKREGQLGRASGSDARSRLERARSSTHIQLSRPDTVALLVEAQPSRKVAHAEHQQAVGEDRAEHGRLDNAQLSLDQRKDGDDQFHGVSEGGVEETCGTGQCQSASRIPAETGARTQHRATLLLMSNLFLPPRVSPTRRASSSVAN